MKLIQRDIDRTYILHGVDGIHAVQARLAEHGICSFTTWESGPPAWRFRYVTYLGASEIQELLRDLWKRYDLNITDGTCPAPLRQTD